MKSEISSWFARSHLHGACYNSGSFANARRVMHTPDGRTGGRTRRDNESRILASTLMQMRARREPDKSAKINYEKRAHESGSNNNNSEPLSVERMSMLCSAQNTHLV